MSGRRPWACLFAAAVTFTVAPEAGAQGSLPSFETDAEARARVAALEKEVVTPPPYEPPFARFGSAGQFVLTNDLVASLSSLSISGSQASSFTGSVVAGFDYFLVRNLSIGLDLEANYANQLGYGSDGSLVRTETSSFAGGPRVGFNIPLGRSFSLYPRATFGIEWAHRDEQTLAGSSATIAGSPTGAPDTTQTGPFVLLYVPVLVHPSPHFFLGFGPFIFRDFGRDQGGPDVGAERTRLGAALELGGYLGGTPPPTVATEEVPHPPARRFGQAGEVVIWGDVTTSAFWTAYDGTSSSNTSISFSPGVDYFVVDHVAIGVGVSVAYSKVSGLDGGLAVTQTNLGVSVAPRVGVEIPLGGLFSLYPRAALYVGYATQNEDSVTNANDDTQVFAGVDGYLPLLVHVAPHVLVGFGPRVAHDLTRSFSYPGGATEQHPETTVGAGFVLGGWL